MVGHKRVPSREGGVEVVVGALSTRMVALGNTVTCYNRSGEHIAGAQYSGEKLHNYEGVTLKYVPTIQKKGLAALTASFFGCLRAAFGRYDIVHVHAEGPAAFCWIPRLTGKRVIVTIHGLDWQRAKWKNGFGSKFIHFGERMAVRWASEIIVLSRSMQLYFYDAYKRRTVLIPNGVPRFEAQEPEIIRQYGLARGNYILYLGRIVPEKGEHYLLEAFCQIHTDKKLIFAGGESDSADYAAQLKAKAADNDRVQFLGFVEGQQLAELYSNAYVYVLPSDVEGMPLTLMEAMSYGNCCLTSDIPECMSVMREFGMSFRKGDVADLRDKLQYLCDHAEVVKEYRMKAADFICQYHNWDTITQQTLALYRGETYQPEIAPHQVATLACLTNHHRKGI